MLSKKCFLVGIITLLSVSLAISAQPVHPTTGEPLMIDCLRGTPDAIDGDLSDWNLEAMTPAVLDAVEQLNSGQASWDNVGDCGGAFYMLWDDENIYIAAVVTDDKLSMNKSDGDIWNADCIEVLFSTTDAEAEHSWTNPTIHYQYGFNANDQIWNWCNMDGPGQSVPDYLQAASSITADGYICEVSIPHSEITPLDWSVGSIIGFHPCIDDTDIDDGDTELQMSWTGLAAHDQSLGFGHMVLSAEPPAAPALPEGWQSQDIGTTGGSVAESDGTWVISADGADIWGSADEFHYAYVPLSGDGTIIARVVDNGTGSNAWAKGGVMIRETLDQGSKHAIMAMTGGEGGGIAFQARPETDGSSWGLQGDITASLPQWVKLTRVGNTITGYYSADGLEWALMTDTSPDGDMTDPIDIEMAADVYIGLFTTSHQSDEIRTYTFDNVSVVESTGFNIIWVSGFYDDDGDGVTDDIGWVELLEAQGHTVDYTMGAAVGDGYWRTLDDDKIAALNAADLIIVSRCSDSGQYDDDDEVAQWNSVTTPIMLQAMHIVRSSRWRWLDTTSLPNLSDAVVEILAPDNPIFAGVESPVQVGDGLVGPTTYVDTTGVGVGNGTLLAQVADTEVAWIVEWEAGVEFYPGSGEIAGGPRMVFCAGTQDEAGVTGRGMYNLTPEGETIFLNAVNHMLPAVDVTAPGDIVQGVPNDGLMDGDNFGWPGAETPDLAIDDDTSTKFLHFKGELEPTGFQVTPSAGPSIVIGLTFTTANDAPERDPIAFELSGSNVGIDGPYELIASGDIVDFAQEAEWPRFTMNSTPISFDNDAAYAHYQVLFPAVRDPASANSMQIAEVELLGELAGPVGHWKLDDGEGIIAVDSSGNGNDGILIGTAMSWMPGDGMIGGALSFDGTASDADYVEISTADISLAAGTIAMWGKLPPDPQLPETRYFCGHTTIPAWSDRIQLYMDNSDTILDLGLGDSHARHTDIMSLTTETWYHVALTWDGGNYVVYVNGEEKANGSYVGLDTLNPLADIGNDGSGAGRYEAFNGLLDDVRIYDRALSADEMSQLASPPPYVYDGDALDDTWNHDNGSDAWDDTAPGEGNPGGAAALTEDGVTFLRIQDIGDPRDLGIGDPSNRKVYLQRPMDISLDGARLEFRIRIATSAPLDDQVTGEPWPAEGIGYHIRDNGKGMIGIGEAGEAGVGIISFSLAQAGEPDFADVATDVLVMNNLVGTEASGDVDTEDAAAAVAMNMIAIDDAAQWNTFTIDIAAGGAGTHIVTVSANGGPAESFEVTIGTDLEGDTSSLLIGSSGTGGITAFDVDYVSVQ